MPEQHGKDGTGEARFPEQEPRQDTGLGFDREAQKANAEDIIKRRFAGAQQLARAFLDLSAAYDALKVKLAEHLEALRKFHANWQTATEECEKEKARADAAEAKLAGLELEAAEFAEWRRVCAEQRSEAEARADALELERDRLRGALREIAESPFCSYENTEQNQYGLGVTDGHRHAAGTAGAALREGEQ